MSASRLPRTLLALVVGLGLVAVAGGGAGVALVVAFLGGVARLVSLLALGSPGPLLLTALVVELTVVPTALAWHLQEHRRRAHDPHPT